MSYEWKKLWGKKLTVISVVILILLVPFLEILTLIGKVYVQGEYIGTQYENELATKEQVKKIQGETIDQAFLDQAKKAITTYDLSKQEITPETYKNYIKYVAPYNTLNMYFARMGIYIGDMDTSQFQQLRKAYIEEYYNEGLTTDEKAIVQKWEKELTRPLTYGWSGAYDYFLSTTHLITLFTQFVITICLASLFSGEYMTHVDALICTSRYGRNRIILAKFLTGIGFTLILSLFTNTIHFVELGLIFGFEGAELPAQLIVPFLLKEWNCMELIRVMMGISVESTLIIGILTLFLSVSLEKPSSTMIMMFIFLFAPLFGKVPPTYRILYRLFNTLPTNIMRTSSALGDTLIAWGNNGYLAYEYVGIFYLLAAGLLLTVSYEIFKKHQIGRG